MSEAPPAEARAAADEVAPEPAPAKRARGGRRRKTPEAADAAEAAEDAETSESPAPEPANDRGEGRAPAAPEAPAIERQLDSAGAEPLGEDGPAGPPRRGWWQRTFGP